MPENVVKLNVDTYVEFNADNGIEVAVGFWAVVDTWLTVIKIQKEIERMVPMPV